MEKQYDDTNKGVLFEPRGEKIAKQGKINIDGSNLNMIVVKKTIPSKQGGTIEILEPYVSAGKIFKSDKQKFKDVEKASDFQGEVETSVGKKYGFYYSRTDKNGNKFISISLAEPREEPNVGAGDIVRTSPISFNTSTPATAEELDDAIPF